MNLIRSRTRRATALAAATTALVMASPGVAFADQVTNSLDNTIDNAKEQMSLVVGGSAKTTQIKLVATKDTAEGRAVCNVSSTAKLVVTLESDKLRVATVSPLTLEFTECDVAQTVTVTPVGEGTANIDFTESTSTTATGAFEVFTARFQAVVSTSAPSPVNTKPSVSVTGATDGGTYEIGNAPTPTCSVTDAEDGPSTTDAVVTGTLDHGLGQLTATCDYTDTGGLTADTKSVTYTIRDTQKPTISASVTPAANSFGWRNTDVTVSFTCADVGGSGVQDCPSPVTLSEGADQSVTRTTTDYAGNTETTSVSGISIDKTAPVIVEDSVDNAATGTAGSNGWFTSDVTVTFKATDNLSGFVGKANPHTFTRTTTGDGDTVTVDSGTVTDRADNTSSSVTSQAFKIDRVAPSVGNAVLSGQPNAAGWYNTAVTASFTATDGTSGVAGDNPKTVSSGSAQGVVVLASPEFKDVAGNTTAAGAKNATVKVDTVAPTVALVGGPADKGSYYYGSVPVAPTCAADDDTSKLAGDCSVSGYGETIGTHTLTASATDNAGNTTTVTRSYTVLAWTLTGFYSPVDMDMTNTVKGGSTVPLKFELFAGKTELTDVSAVAGFKAATINCLSLAVQVDDIEVYSTGGTSLRYDTTGGQFIQNWKVPTGAGTCYKVTMTAKDGSAISANFKVK